MSIRVTLEMSGLLPEELAALGDVMADASALHLMISVDAERYIKEAGPGIAAQNHRSALRLGAEPTGHLADAYQAIEADYSEDSASLLVPRASRLRAAFGGYRVLPVNSQFLTLPYIAAAYGRRAREFNDLEFGIELVSLPNGYTGPMRVLKKEGTSEVYYTLVTKADIPEQEGLIPFDELANEARRSAGEYIDLAIEAHLENHS